MNDRKRTGWFPAGNNRWAGVALPAMLAAGIDWFVPPRVRTGDLDVFRRARLVVAFAWTLILLAIIYAVILFLMNSPIGTAALVAGAGMGVASLCVMRRTGSHLVVGNLLTAAFFGTLTALTCRVGGHNSVALPWYAAVSVVALSTAGRRSAAVWLAVATSSLATFCALGYSGHSFPNDLSPHHHELLCLLSLAGLIVLMPGLALLYETAKNQTFAELKSAKGSLLREKGFSDSTIASLPGIFYLFDSEGRFLRWNENFERVSGYSPGELSKMQPLDFFRGQDREVIEQSIEDVFTKGQDASEAGFITRCETAIPHLLFSKRVMIDGELHLVGLGIDITDRKRAEELLQKRAFQQAEMARFGEFALSGLSLDELFERAVALISRGLGTKYAKILEHRPEQGVFFLRAGVGWKEGWVGHKSVPDGAGSQGGYTLLRKKPVIAEDLHNETRFTPPALLTEHNAVGGMTVAIPGRERPFGTLGVHTDCLQHFSDDDIHFLEAVANVLAGAIERCRSAAELQRSETKFRTLYNSTSDAVMLLDKRGFFDCNDATVIIFGCKDKAEFCSKHPSDLSPAEQPCGRDSLTLANEQIATAMKNGSHRFEWMHKRLDTGENLPAEVLLNAMELDGRMVLQAVVRDITERKRAEDEIRRSEARFRDVALSMSDWVWECDAEGRYTYCSDQALDLLGYTVEEILGKTPFDMMPAAEVTRVKKIFRKIAAGKEPIRDLENRNVAKNGHEVVLLTNAVPRLDEEGNLLGYRGVDKDITERKRAENELAKARDEAEAANRAKSKFLANMSHEIRTPMTAILGFADILMGGKMDREQLDAAATIKQNGKHLIGIINDILDLSKIEAEKLEVEHIQCSPCRILSEVVSLMRARAGAKNLPLEIKYHGPIPRSIRSDPTRLRQILINLTGNAVKFTEVGKVRLAVRLLDAEYNDPKIQFEVTDSGIGMTEEQTARLFKPFSQVDSSTTRKFGGTGLGLMISKRLAEKLGGDIAVRSTLGEGSTFTITVGTGPLDGVKLFDNPAEAQISTDTGKKPGDSETKLKGRILLAEDGPDNQRLISFLLKKAGAEVAVAENGQIAHDLALAKRDEGNPFDVILMDMQMPVMDGYDATGRLREAGYTGPIIALTANAMAGDDETCRQAGCDGYATKPIDQAKLFATIARYAGKQPQPTDVDVGNDTGGVVVNDG